MSVYPIKIEMFDVISLTEIASRITPKNLRIMKIPLSPSIRCILWVILRTIYTQIIFAVRPKRMFIEANSAFSESNVVNAPGPASKGNTRGTRVASLIGPLFLKISMSRIISSAIAKIIIPPANATELMSTWKSFKSKSPARKNTSISTNDRTDALSALTERSLC